LVVRTVAFTRNNSPADNPGQLHPAEAASSISQMQPNHRACAMALYDAIFAYPLDEDYPGEAVIYEATAEPARSSERVAAKWQRVCRRATVVPVRGSHNSIIKQPDGVALARDLSNRLVQIAARYRSNMGSFPA
jgi:thioesterase domain-containing protein